MVAGLDAFGDIATGNGPIFGTGFHSVPPPTNFSVKFSSDKTILIFTIFDTHIGISRRLKSQYRIYFAPITLASPAVIANPFRAYDVFQQSVVIATVSAPENGGSTTVTDTTRAGLDGWFFCTAVNLYGIESAFLGPLRNPIVGVNDTRIPPNVVGQIATLSDAGLDTAGRQLIRVNVSAKTPSQINGVSTVQMINLGRGYGGTGYTHDFFVDFLGGDGPGGAVGRAHVRDGAVWYVEVTAAGEYTTAPTVDFSNGDGLGAAGYALLTTAGSFVGFQIYLGNYFDVGILVEGPTALRNYPQPGDTIRGEFLLIDDTVITPPHSVVMYFVALSQTGTRTDAPASAPSVTFPTGIHL